MSFVHGSKYLFWLRFLSLQLYIFIYWRLHRDFIAAWAFLVEDSGDCSSLRLTGSSLASSSCGAPPYRGSLLGELRLADFCGCSTRAKFNWGSQAQYSKYRLSCFTASRSGIESVSSTLAGGLFATELTGSPVLVHFYKYLFDSCSVQNLSVSFFRV